MTLKTLQTKIIEWTKSQGVNPDDVQPFQEEITFKAAADDEEKRDGVSISGFLSTFKNIDREGDVVMRNAFDASVKELKRAGKLPMLKDHEASTDSQIGSFTKFKITDEGLMVTGFISRTKNTEHIIKLIEDGHINTLSMGGLFSFANGGQRDKRDRRFIENVALFEGSVVVVPANPKAEFSQKSSTPETPANAEPVAKAKATPVASHREKMIQALSILKQSGEGKL